MIKQENIALLNRIANQPEVLQEIAPGYLNLDLTRFFDKPSNLMVGDERGVVLFSYLGSGLYRMDYLLTNSLRGPPLRWRRHQGSRWLALMPASHWTNTPRQPPRKGDESCSRWPALRCICGLLGRHCIDYALERATWVRFSGA